MRLKLAFLTLSFCLILYQPTSADPVRLAPDEGLMGKFSQSRFLAGFDKPIISAGQFFLLPGTALIWQTEKPFKSFMVIDDEGISQSVAGKEISKLSIAQFPSLSVLRDVLEDSLSGNWEPLETMTGSKTVRDTDSWRLEFIPAESDVKFPFTALSFEMTDYLDKIDIKKGEEDRDIITFSDQQKAPLGDVRSAAQKSRQAPL
ncbi:outer membrane lipoprotein carrier protein LolA [Sneathiella marina]|uniref:Outer membrane lipoprotein carrier protein LolA n=1 Tax=Sneathiella marina TaxID=2950108 RepID=A0ABY4WA48_9PROT|nr:outer membrane lipoprotein carrier protein LolA [Sneathiella marina]USG62620.1 outer membrane lipoprotein carrier protein LolA [Sneathiella marina]